MATPEEEITAEPQSQIAENSDATGDIRVPRLVEDKLKERVDMDFANADGARTQWIEKKSEGLRLLWGLMPHKEFPFKNCSNVNVPLLRTLFETLSSNLFGSFNSRTPFDVLPVGNEDVEKARKVKKFLNWQFTNEISYPQLLDRILQFTLTYGHAVAKVRYVKETRNKKVPLRPGDSAVLETFGIMGDEREVLFDGVKIDILNPEDVLFPSDAPGSDVDGDMDFIIHEIPMSASEIRKRIASGEYRGVRLEDTKEGSSQTSTETRSLRHVIESHIGTNNFDRSATVKASSDKRTVLEWYGFFDLDKDGQEEPVMVTYLKEGREILKIIPWDTLSRPFAVIRFSPIYNTPWGESVGDLVGQINEELNTLHNQRVDAVTINNVPFGFYDPLSGFDPDDVALVPGLMLPTNGDPRNAVYFPPMQPVKPEMYREEELLMAYAERLMGAGANVQGGINPRRLSATEVATVDRRAGIRFFLLFKRIQKGLQDVAKLVLEYDSKFMPPSKQIRVMGAHDFPLFEPTVTFEQFDKEDMEGKFDLIAVGESIMDEEANKQEMLTAYQLGITNPLIATDPESVYNLTRDTLLALGAKNVNSYIKKPQFAVPQSPEDEHNKMGQGTKVEPVLGENVEKHINEHANFINSPQFQLLPQETQVLIVEHLKNTIKMKAAVIQMQQLQGNGNGQQAGVQS